ncbi:MAG: uroporphyrinogen-III synthase [Colwellia sp.]
MLRTINSSPLKVLITRPEAKAQELTLLLKQQGIMSIKQPLFDYQAYASPTEIKAQLDLADILIFISVAAVEFAQASMSLSVYQQKTIVAVGSATKKALQDCNIRQVICPAEENSEGLLQLPLFTKEFNKVSNKKLASQVITIVRGNGGREYLSTTLKARGASVQYLESYQRVWRTFANDIAKQWQAQQINCIVVTSNESLKKMLQLVLSTNASDANITDANVANDCVKHKQHENYWKKHCLWLVASQRIADSAKQLGLKSVIISKGASAKSLISALMI